MMLWLLNSEVSNKKESLKLDHLYQFHIYLYEVTFES